MENSTYHQCWTPTTASPVLGRMKTNSTFSDKLCDRKIHTFYQAGCEMDRLQRQLTADQWRHRLSFIAHSSYPPSNIRLTYWSISTPSKARFISMGKKRIFIEVFSGSFDRWQCEALGAIWITCLLRAGVCVETEVMWRGQKQTRIKHSM